MTGLTVIREYRRLAVLIVIMTAVAVIVGATAIGVLYDTAFERERLRLGDIVQSQAALIGSVAAFNRRYTTYPEGAEAATLSEILTAYRNFERRGLGTTGEMTIGRRDGDFMVYVFRHQSREVEPPPPLPFGGPLGQPMAAALSGQTGTMVGLDYAGHVVMAAFAPVPSLGLGLVAKIDMAELRARYLRAGAIAAAVGAVVIVLAAVLFLRISEPIMRDLRESEARFRGLFENMSTGAAVYAATADGADFVFRDFNRAGERIEGLSHEQVIGRRLGDLYPNIETMMGLLAALRRVWRTGQPEKLPSLFYQDSRISGWRENFIYRLPSGEVVAIYEDTSERERTAAELRRLYLAIEQSPASVVITEPNGDIVYVNPKFCEVSGYTASEVIGRNPRVLRSGHTTSAEYRKLWKTIASGEVWRGEFHNRRKNGELYWELASIAPVKDETGRIINYVGVKEDVTQLKATEDQLRQSQKMQAIGQLTGGIAHDFNNLLTIVIGNLQLLEEAIGPNHQLRGFIADAVWSAQRGAELTHRLLAFARRQPLHPAATDLNEVVRDLTGLLRRVLGSTIDIGEELAGDLAAAPIDRTELERAIVNLAINARDAMPEGGKLVLATSNVVLDEHYAERYPDVVPGDYVMLSVSDSGSGIPPDILSRVFEPFFTTKDVGEGSGLGLSMVYGFVKQSGGHVSLYSEVGRGTTIKLFFPAVDTKAAATATPTVAADTFRVHGKRALIVEDEEKLRKIAATILERAGFTVMQAENGPHALSLAQVTERIDLLFTDLELPGGMDGAELATRLRQRYPELKILYTTGYSPRINDRLATAAPVLAKPYARAMMMQYLRALFIGSLDKVERAGEPETAASKAGPSA